MKTFIRCLFLFLLRMQLSANEVIWDKNPLEIRDQINSKILAIETAIIDVHDVQNAVIEGERKTNLRIYKPSSGDNLPIILLIHGGAWIAGSLDTHDNLARFLCKKTDSLVVSVGYLNAPEGKFPLPLEQCYDVLIWISLQAKELGADTSRIAVVGDSAGGNMSAALCLLSRDRKGPAIHTQVLINPATNLSEIERKNDALDILRWYAHQYLADPKDAKNEYVSPLLAKDLSNLPQALILLAENDHLRADGQSYADRLEACGVSTTVYTQYGVGHLAGHCARAAPLAYESLNIAVKALKKRFSSAL